MYWEKVKYAQTVQTQIRLRSSLIRVDQEQSVQDLQCLPFHLHLFDPLLNCKTKQFHFKTTVVISFIFLIFLIFMVTRSSNQSAGGLGIIRGKKK